MKASLLFAFLGAASSAYAHMEMTSPPPLRSKNNPHAGSDVDYNLMAPITGDSYPCKGSLGLLGTPAGASVIDYKAGQTYSATIGGGANHNGGSCQFSLSYDGGQTFTVIKDIVGNCPTSGSGSYDFTIPSDAPSGEALFSWSWFNKVGNREMYHNCAVVTISGSSSAKRQDSIAFSQRPAMFVANVGGSCSTSEGVDLMFPNLGPDVDMNSQNTGPPLGDCAGGSSPAPAPGDGGSGGDDSTGGDDGQAPPVDAPAPAPAPTSAPAGGAPAPTPSAEPNSPPSDGTPTLPGGVFLTVPTGGAKPTGDAPSEDAPVSTTLVTSVKPTSAPAEPSPTAQPTPPADAPDTPVEVPETGGGSGQGEQSGACSTEGAWNCIGGTAFQRCASGRWSATINMAAGTSCQPGVSDTLNMVPAKKFRFRRY